MEIPWQKHQIACPNRRMYQSTCITGEMRRDDFDRLLNQFRQESVFFETAHFALATAHLSQFHMIDAPQKLGVSVLCLCVWTVPEMQIQDLMKKSVGLFCKLENGR
jgi:hypothetical protein